MKETSSLIDPSNEVGLEVKEEKLRMFMSRHKISQINADANIANKSLVNGNDSNKSKLL
jgi:hypothetical protein